MAWIDYESAYNMVPHSWNKECLDVFTTGTGGGIGLYILDKHDFVNRKRFKINRNRINFDRDSN